MGAGGIEMIDAASANTGAPPVVWIGRADAAAWAPGQDFDGSGASTGDADVAVGADGWMYALNLAYSPSPPQQPANPTVFVYRSRDGRTWQGPATFPAPHGLDQPDRPWLVVDPSVPADVDVASSEGGGNIVMWRSGDHGASFAGPVAVTGGGNGQAALALSSRPLVQPGDHLHIDMLYETVGAAGVAAVAGAGTPVGEFPMSQLWMATSTDGGGTWSNREVLDTAAATDPAIQGGSLAHLLVASALDAAGHLYAAVSVRAPGATQTHIFLSHSLDGGTTWSAPARVDGTNGGSNVMPALGVAGDGTAYLSWYASASSDYRDSAARWVEMAASTADPLDAQPSFRHWQVSGPAPVHIGGVDTAGTVGSDLGDDWGLRDFQSLAVDACHRPHLVWAVDAGHPATQTAVLLIPCHASSLGSTPTAGASATAHAAAAALPDTASASSRSGGMAAAVALLGGTSAAARRRRRRAQPASADHIPAMLRSGRRGPKRGARTPPATSMRTTRPRCPR
jgi:hypothetical protein